MIRDIKAVLAASGVATAALCAALPAQAADIGVSVGVSQPGVYGRIDIGRFPQPQLIVQQPLIIERVVRAPEPVYMHVPPGHRQQWSRYCRNYGACGVPVYFVQDGWYEQKVRPHSQDRSPKHDKGNKSDKHDKHDKHGKGNKHDRDDGGRGHGKHD